MLVPGKWFLRRSATHKPAVKTVAPVGQCGDATKATARLERKKFVVDPESCSVGAPNRSQNQTRGHSYKGSNAELRI